jgi:hypothetical protein
MRDTAKLQRLPGAKVDWQHIDQFHWTTALLVEYAERAAELAFRYAGHGVAQQLPRWPAGPHCQDCERRTERARVRYGRFLLCPACGRARARVAKSKAA